MMTTNNGYMDPNLEEIASVLEKARIKGGVLRACCPAHGGEDANLSIQYADDGKLLARCHSHHCEFKDIIAAIRQKLGMDNDENVVNITHKGRRLGERPKPKNDAVKNRTVWELRDEAGKLVALHVRDDLDGGDKKVWWRRPSGEAGLGPKGTSELPLYGAEDASRAPAGSWMVVTEGEKAADALRSSRALRESGIGVVGTVTGAASTPGSESLAVLKGQRVILWPDNDSAGAEHMGRIAEALAGVAFEVRWFEWEEAPEKGDAADYVDDGSLAGILKVAPRWSKPPAIEGRALIGRAIEKGVDPPTELLPDMLLAGKAHNVYAPGGVGKTWLLVWIATELVRRGKKVVVFDLENGLRTYAERFEEMGADPKALDDLLYYFAFPTFDRASYERLLDEECPDIVMFDSWIGFLAADGKDENVSNDISSWADAYSKPALRRGSAVLVLDHVPHEHERERGSSRKRDEMDVVWKLTKIGDFDRDQTATLSMSRQKDREGWLPEKLTFEVGGDPSTGRFIMRRDDSLARRVEVTHLKSNEKVALGALEEFGEKGATTSEWLTAMLGMGEEISKPTLHRIRRALVKKDRVLDKGNKYVAIVADRGVDAPPVSGVSVINSDTPDTGAPGGMSPEGPPKGGPSSYRASGDIPPLRQDPVNFEGGMSGTGGTLGERLRAHQRELRKRRMETVDE